jgi:hypothetical protein
MSYHDFNQAAATRVHLLATVYSKLSTCRPWAIGASAYPVTKCWVSKGRMIRRLTVIRWRGSPFRGDDQSHIHRLVLRFVFLTHFPLSATLNCTAPSLVILEHRKGCDCRQLKTHPSCPALAGCGALSVIRYRLSRHPNSGLHHVTRLCRDNLHRLSWQCIPKIRGGVPSTPSHLNATITKPAKDPSLGSKYIWP